MGHVCRAMRTLLIKTWPLLLVASIPLTLWRAATYHVYVPIGLMALGGMLCGQMREIASREDGARDRANRDVAEFMLRLLLATRSQPAGEGLRLVTDEGSGSEPPAQERSAG